jgi:hypothetical protein
MTTEGIGGFILACAATALITGVLIGYAIFGRSPQRVRPPEGYEDLLVHPETTPEVKWVKMTKPTRDALMDIYAANADQCNKFMHANNRVTIGEAAILWLMEGKK